MIKINNLEKYFNRGRENEIHAVNRTSLEFNNTGLVCIVGESGCGKTTLLNIIGGLDTFQSGEITIDDMTIRKYSAKKLEQLRVSNFSYIFQNYYLLQDYTVDYNIRLALSMYNILEEEKNARVDYVLEAFEIEKYRKRKVSQLSSGQRQRVAIARALIKSPSVIFADEPTGNLDEENTLKTMDILKKISEEHLVILVTHEKNIVDYYADRVIYIKNGIVESDVIHTESRLYKRTDDSNLYLKEYEPSVLNNKNVNVNLYHDGSENGFTLNMICADGKLYIQSPDEKEIVFLTADSRTKMIDSKRPEYEKPKEFNFHLPKLRTCKTPRLSFKEIRKMTAANLQVIGKKQIFMMVTFILTAVLLVITAANYMTLKTVDKTSIVSDDSHYITVKTQAIESATADTYNQNFNDFYNQLLGSGYADDVYMELRSGFTTTGSILYSKTELDFRHPGFGQINLIKHPVTDLSFVTMEHFDEADLFEGRMPQAPNEIIIDKWLIDQFWKSENVVFKFMPAYEDFLGNQVEVKGKGDYLTIVGICDSGEPSIYIDKYMRVNIASWSDSISSVKQLQTIYPGKFDDLSLQGFEALVPESVYEKMNSSGNFTKTTSYGITYTVVGSFPDGPKVSYVVAESTYDAIVDAFNKISKNFRIYTKDKEGVFAYINAMKEDLKEKGIEITVKDISSDQLNAYEQIQTAAVIKWSVISAVILSMAMFMLYFSMKSNAMKRLQELTVFRVIGIVKSSILATYALEIIILTSYTVLPTVVVTSIVIMLLGNIKSFGIHFVYPWYTMFLILIVLYAVNVFIGLLPVFRLIKQPPAKIAEKL